MKKNSILLRVFTNFVKSAKLSSLLFCQSPYFVFFFKFTNFAQFAKLSSLLLYKFTNFAQSLVSTFRLKLSNFAQSANLSSLWPLQYTLWEQGGDKQYIMCVCVCVCVCVSTTRQTAGWLKTRLQLGLMKWLANFTYNTKKNMNI